MFCKKSFQSFVPTQREFRVSYQINSHFLRGLQAFSVLLPWISLCRDPRQGLPSSLRANLTRFLLPYPAPSGFASAAIQPEPPPTNCPSAPGHSNLWALRRRSWLHQQKGSCRFGKFPSEQQRLKTSGLILCCNLTATREVSNCAGRKPLLREWPGQACGSAGCWSPLRHAGVPVPASAEGGSYSKPPPQAGPCLAPQTPNTAWSHPQPAFTRGQKN